MFQNLIFHQLDAVIISHAHLDHSGLLPYLYKMGYKGPVYMTAPTRDIAALLALILLVLLTNRLQNLYLILQPQAKRSQTIWEAARASEQIS